MNTPDRVTMIYIAAPADKVWAALVDPEISRDYFLGISMEVGPGVGADFVLRRPDGSVDSRGEVLAWDPPRLLAVSWQVVWLEDLRLMAPGRVEYRVEPQGLVVAVTVSEFFGGLIPDKYAETARTGWAMILSGLKTLLETGAPMPTVSLAHG